ncbi:hypothetical protein [Streptomyces sp. TP-A0356]|uniref:hypothetical protein n=1 Tax=Streptomyces sp. TP-A0356 TaxID=1359208 RepID=UPI000A698B05|nr:hypothetical protein [Streptomyces sp. TP-A0356]
MRWLLFGALIGLLIVYPSLVTLVAAVVVALLSKPVPVAFALGLIAGVRLRRSRRWTA